MNTILQASLWIPQASYCFRQCWRLQDLRTVHPCSVCLVFWSGSVDSIQKKKKQTWKLPECGLGRESSSYWWAKKKKQPNISPLPCNWNGTLQLVTAFHWDLLTVSSVVHVLQASEIELSDTVPTWILLWLVTPYSPLWVSATCRETGSSPVPTLTDCPFGFILFLDCRWGSLRFYLLIPT